MLVRVREEREKAQQRYSHLRKLQQEQQFLEEEHKEITYQLTCGRPMVTEMLTFLNKKAAKEDTTVQMKMLIDDIESSLIQVEDQGELFGSAAKYKSVAAAKPY